MDHVGSGKDWDLARKDGGIIFLPPFGSVDNDTLYTTRLEALKGVLSFLERADEEYVVMTDCDSICRINYSEVIDNHIKNHADITLIYKKTESSAVFSSDLVMGDNERVVAINLKSDETNTTKNIFINMFVLKRSLLLNIVKDSISRNKHHFLADVISDNLSAMRVFGYEHKGFFAGITSMQAYYDSNLKLLDRANRAELFGDRGVFTKVRDSAPTKYGNSSIVKNSMIADGAIIEGEVENSIIFRNVKVARGSVIRNSIIMQDSIISENCIINCIIADKNVVIKDRKVLSGSDNHPFYIGKGIMV
jgi:glucose-1-phosphate adenylyltransferase